MDTSRSDSIQSGAGTARNHADVKNIFGFGDDLGPHKIIHVHDPSISLNAVLVVDNVAAGPAIGGLRMAPDVTTGECYRLARAMTLKNAAAGLAHGGGKSVLMGDPGMDPQGKEDLIRAFACALRGEEDYIFGPDMGTDEQCMGWILDEIGRAVGLPREVGGIPLDQLGATGWGVYHSVCVALDKLKIGLDGARVVIQGFGSVGYHSARFMARDGAKIVAVSDSRGALRNDDGLDIDALWALKKDRRGVAEFDGGEVIDGDALISVPCDIWVPAARPDVIHGGNVAKLDTKIVAQGANIPLTEDAEQSLHSRNVLVLPDFIANAGGVICAAMEYHGSSQSDAFQSIEDKTRVNTAEMLARTEADDVTPRAAAMVMAEERVRAAMTTRRWSVF